MTPRPYLSWSSLDSLERSEQKWVEHYLHGLDTFSNGAMDFGSKMAKALEDDEDTGDALSDLVLAHLPKMARRDEILHAQIGRGKDAVPVIAKIDSASEDWLDDAEYKTGKGKWTQGKADRSGQITFYSMVVWLAIGKIPKFRLVWMPTEIAEDGSVSFTGSAPVVFHTQRTMVDVVRMMERASRAWKRMQELTAEATT